MSAQQLLDAAGRLRSPATMPGHHAGRSPRNKGQRYPADPPTVEEIVEANFGRHPAGTRIYVVEDTKVDGHDVRVQLEPVDDPRLPDPEEDRLGG